MAFGIDDAIAAGLKIIDKFVPDPAAKAEAEAALRNSLMQWDKAQTDVNAVEAANSNVFVSGWRPSIGWSCSAAFWIIFVIGPIVSWVATLLGHPVTLPQFNIDALMSMTMGMLGLAGMRSWEKYKGLTK